MRNRQLAASLILAASALLPACDWNSVTTGDHGLLEFTPDDCGHDDGCDLDDPIIVGGRIEVTLDAVDPNISVENLTLISSNPFVLDVRRISVDAFSSEWQVTGVGEGWAELVAIDQFGGEIDHTDVQVLFADRLTLDDRAGNALFEQPRADFAGEVWSVPAGQSASLAVRPLRGNQRLMGEFAYSVSIDQPLFDALAPTANLERGLLRFTAPLGENTIDFVAADGTRMSAMIIGR